MVEYTKQFLYYDFEGRVYYLDLELRIVPKAILYSSDEIDRVTLRFPNHQTLVDYVVDNNKSLTDPYWRYDSYYGPHFKGGKVSVSRALGEGIGEPPTDEIMMFCENEHEYGFQHPTRSR